MRGVNVSYGKAGQRRMKKVGDGEFTRKPYVVPMMKPKPLDELTEYVETRREEISTLEAIREFQLEHEKSGGHSIKKMKVLAKAGHYNSGPAVLECPTCGAIRIVGSRMLVPEK